MNAEFFEKVNLLCSRCPASWESGDRTPKHNASVGGKSGSFHLQGKALDLIYDTVEELIWAAHVAVVLGFNGIEMDLTNNHLHVDGRPTTWQIVRINQGGQIVEKDLIIYLTTQRHLDTIKPT